MRRISAQLETVGSGRFILLVGLVAGTIQSIPRLLLGGAASVRPQLISFLIIGGAAVLWWTAAFLLWRIAVRRQSPLWIIASQVTLGLVLADAFVTVIAAVIASVDTHGEFATMIMQQPSTFILSNLTVTLFRCPLWLAGAALAIGLGRHLNVGGQTNVGSSSN